MTLPWCALSMRHVTCVWSETYCLIRRNNAMYARNTVVSVLKPLRWRYGSFMALTHQASSIHSPPLHYFSRWHIVYHIVYDVDLTASYLSLSYRFSLFFFYEKRFSYFNQILFFFINKKSAVSNSVQHSNSTNMPMPFNIPLEKCSQFPVGLLYENVYNISCVIFHPVVNVLNQKDAKSTRQEYGYQIVSSVGIARTYVLISWRIIPVVRSNQAR
jgi:hypothetical protein